MALQKHQPNREQKKSLSSSDKSHSDQGVAGSRKTTIAMYRAKHLLDTYSDLFRELNHDIFI